MKKLFIFIIAMFICIALAGCSSTKVVEDSSTEPQNSENLEQYSIRDSTVISKFNEKEIVIWSDTSCYFDLTVSIVDGDSRSLSTFTGFEISENETIALSVEDLANNFYSYSAIIEDVDAITTVYNYEDSSNKYIYSPIQDSSILMKYTSNEITVHSDFSCFFDLYVSTEGTNFDSKNKYCKLKIEEGETIIFTLDDLAPGFFDDEETFIKYAYLGLYTYVEQ